MPSFAVAEAEGYSLRCLLRKLLIIANRESNCLRQIAAPCQRFSQIKIPGYISRYFYLAEAEGFEPPWACTQTVFKFYPAFIACCSLFLFNSPNCRKISVLTALLSDTSVFLLCFGIVSRSLLLLISSAFLTAFCRDFVENESYSVAIT